MILQFKTFGTISSIFLHLSQYLSKEKIHVMQMTKQIQEEYLLNTLLTA